MSSSPDDHPLKSNASLDESRPPPPPPKDAVPNASTAKSPSAALPDGRALSTSPPPSSSTATLSSSSTVTSGSSTPTNTTIESSVFSPTGSKLNLRAASPAASGASQGPSTLVSQAFAPHVSVLSSPDCEELLRHKGLHGGLLELLRPFGEQIPGRVVVRDSTGASRPWDDFGIRFTGIKDGLEAPRLARSPSESRKAGEAPSTNEEYRPARLRSGGDVVQIEQLVERRLDTMEDGAKAEEPYGTELTSAEDSSYYDLYLRKLLSGTVLSPHETFAHPVALVVAISSRSPSPIEELRTLYANSNTGEYRLPPWVNNEYLRYYVLVHDEDFDDIKKSTTLYEQMKRHFGLHCHLLRLRSTQCLPSDDESMRFPAKNWTSAAEDLADMTARESAEDEEDTSTYVFESDATAVRSFVREMVTQSIIPSMERSVATWNDQVASRRRGISGRFMSLSKRFTPFGSRSNSPSTSSGSNYDSSQGFYRPEAPEAVIRKLADYAMMLRDYKLAQATYEMLCSDFKNDKAWRYYAGANEMAAITTMLITGSMSAKFRADTVDQFLENAYYSYFSRCNSPFLSSRTILMGAEFLRVKEGSSLDDAARWLSRLIDDRNIGPVGHALLLERIGSCFASKRGAGILESGSRTRKAALWTTLATRAWLEMDKPHQATKCLHRALDYYARSRDGDNELHFDGMKSFLADLEWAVKPASQREKAEKDTQDAVSAEQIQQITEKVDQRTHRRSVSLAAVNTSFDPLGAVPASPMAAMPERPAPAEDGFE